MAVVDLNLAFPRSEKTGTHGPLPKQAEFMKAVLDPKGPKYIGFVSGIGAGKTLVGCITILAMALQHPGDYLVCRMYMPELKITTLKTFLEVCPKELIDEYRVADGIIKIKASGGRFSNIIFRQLEESDKLRSLNLSGAYIDEASQVPEAAFMLLQGRLRGPGLRKLFLTSNPNGHDWIYRWFFKQDHFKNEEAKKAYRLVRATSLDNTHLPDGYIQSMLEAWSEDRIRREIEGSFDAFEGSVYPEFRRDVHVIKPFKIPTEWTKIIGIDHGFRNPACWIWGAVDYDENIYIYREFYEREWLIEEIVRGKKKENKPGVIQLMAGEKVQGAYIDPSTRAVRGTTGASDWDAYIENLPKTFPLSLARNEKTAGIDRVKSYLKIQPSNNKPRLFIFDTCVNLLEEMTQYRYAELGPNQTGRMNEKEEPVKVNDHSLDALRYLIMSRPDAPVKKDDIWKKIKYNSLEGSIYRDLQVAKKPKTSSDPWSE